MEGVERHELEKDLVSAKGDEDERATRGERNDRIRPKCTRSRDGQRRLWIQFLLIFERRYWNTQGGPSSSSTYLHGIAFDDRDNNKGLFVYSYLRLIEANRGKQLQNSWCTCMRHYAQYNMK